MPLQNVIFMLLIVIEKLQSLNYAPFPCLSHVIFVILQVILSLSRDYKLSFVVIF